MGSIDLAHGVFRAGTTDTRMDILARSPLYKIGLNYRHGTGHGIGSYGLVHESPIQESKEFDPMTYQGIIIQVRVYKKEEHELKVGMFFSDEPGVYLENMFGVRQENDFEKGMLTYTYTFDNQRLETVLPVVEKNLTYSI